MRPPRAVRPHLTPGRVGFLTAAAIGALSLVPAMSTAAGAHAATLTLPAERTSPTGNYFTLEAYDPPTKSKPVANFQMKVCTSAHTPADTAIDPALFTLALTHGTSAESLAVAKKPAMVLKPLAKNACTEGWLGFRVAKGKAPVKLEYDYNGTISWAVG
jgi:hypothetical protein